MRWKGVYIPLRERKLRQQKAGLSARRRFSRIKCCRMHEWPLRWAAPQHSEVDVKVRNGPIMSIDTKGGKKTFAADANQVGFQYQILKTATESSYSNCCTTTSNHRPRLPFRRFDVSTQILVMRYQKFLTCLYLNSLPCWQAIIWIVPSTKLKPIL